MKIADEALAMGLVNYVVDDDAFDAGLALSLDTSETARERRLCVPDGEEDRSSRARDGHQASFSRSVHDPFESQWTAELERREEGPKGPIGTHFVHGVFFSRTTADERLSLKPFQLRLLFMGDNAFKQINQFDSWNRILVPLNSRVSA